MSNETAVDEVRAINRRRLIWVTMFSLTDQPGYAYATNNYVQLVTGILLVAVLAMCS